MSGACGWAIAHKMQLTVNARLAEINRRFYRSQFL
jgi:hypothetical protein